MKYRILQKVRGNQVSYTPQRKTLLGWKNIEGYYRSDFTDMPGWMTTQWNSADDAMKALLEYKNGVNIQPPDVIYEE